MVVKSKDVKKINIYWVRRDFRLTDNPALYNSVLDNGNNFEFLPIFILEDYMTKASPDYQFGYPSRYFLAKAIPEFAKNFKKFLVLKGKGAKTLIKTVREIEKNNHKVKIFVNEDVYPDFYKQIRKIQKAGIKIEVFDDMISVNKNLKTSTGNLYSVFTPFKKAVWQDFVSKTIYPKITTDKLSSLKYHGFKAGLDSSNLWQEFEKNRKILVGNQIVDIDKLIKSEENYDKTKNFYCTENEALKRFENFLHNDLENYKEKRNSLEMDVDQNGTSKMSLGLAWGLVSARYLNHLIKSKKEFFINSKKSEDLLDFDWRATPKRLDGPIHYISELIWREFYKYLLFNNPKLMGEEFQEKYRNKIKWVDQKTALFRFEKWIRGETGYKIVDAAMHEIRQTGLMHNRSRMIVASVLTKNFGVDWRWGQEYFRAMLLDLDEASNNGGWQWGASVGADPKPIRIFNPYLQEKNYDKSGRYRRKWLSKERFEDENKNMTVNLFKKDDNENEGVNIEPLIEHKIARQEALKRYGLK